MKLRDLQAIYETPFFDLIGRSREVYLAHWKMNEVQLCTLLSIKTGGCSEDCGYCAQSARYNTGVERETLMSPDAIEAVAVRARENGSTRFCMGAAWKGVRNGDPRFESVLESVRRVAKLGMEVCVTLGQLGEKEAVQLKDAGVTAYNHNIDTSPEHYPSIVTTHTFQDRLDTIGHVQKSGMSVCCGGIIGMGETELDRLKMLEVLTNFDPAPESVPINCLMPMRRAAARGHLPTRAPHRHHAHRTAARKGAPQRRPHASHARRPGAVFLRRCEFHLLRRQTPHRRQSRRGRRPRVARRTEPQAAARAHRRAPRR